MVAIAVLPWLSFLISSADLPGGWKITFREISKKVKNQEKIINDLVILSMASFLFDHLKNIYYAKKFNKEYIFHRNADFIDDHQFLRDNGYIKVLGIRDFTDEQDIAKDIEITRIGAYYVELRERREAELKQQSAK